MHRRDQGPFDLEAGGRPAGVDHPGHRVAALAGQLQAAALVGVEHGAEGDQLVDPARALVDQHAHGVGVTEPDAGGQGVGQVEVGGVLVRPTSTAATPPWAHRVADWESSALDSTPMRSPSRRGLAAARTAADRPATPLPRMRRSRSGMVCTVRSAGGQLGDGLGIAGSPIAVSTPSSVVGPENP